MRAPRRLGSVAGGLAGVVEQIVVGAPVCVGVDTRVVDHGVRQTWAPLASEQVQVQVQVRPSRLRTMRAQAMPMSPGTYLMVLSTRPQAYRQDGEWKSWVTPRYEPSRRRIAADVSGAARGAAGDRHVVAAAVHGPSPGVGGGAKAWSAGRGRRMSPGVWCGPGTGRAARAGVTAVTRPAGEG